MSKHNYSQYSNKKNEQVNEEEVAAVVEEVAPAIEPETVEAPAVETVEVEAPVVESKPKASKPKAKKPETTKGVVANCARLNVRAKPASGAEVVSVLDAASEIEININKSTDEWYHVCTATGVEGYCMRKFVEARL